MAYKQKLMLEIPAFIRRLLPPNREHMFLKLESGLKIHWMEIGTGLPVLMLHGNPTWGFVWRKVADQLSGQKLRLIIPDLVGFGFSSPMPKGGHSLENHANIILEFIDHLKLEPMIFIGQGWGASIGLRALAERPNLLKGLVLLNTGARPPVFPIKQNILHRLSRIPLLSDFIFGTLGLPLRLLHLAQSDPESIRGDVAKAYRYPLRAFGHNKSPLQLARMLPNDARHPSIIPLMKVEDFLRKYDGPTEIVWGCADPMLGKNLRRIEEILPGAFVFETDGGHFLQEECPDTIAQAILRINRGLRPPQTHRKDRVSAQERTVELS